MCGLAGLLLHASTWSEEQLVAVATNMASSLEHRGPDEGGTWTDAAAGIALGHRRLSIVDLTSAGSQPMVSASGRWVLVYNGELYNAGELRAELAATGLRFRGHSDTEVLIEAIERSGVEPTSRALNGMFAFAAWDRAERRLWLARDRLGEKPLYYGWAGRSFVFASELKAIRCHPDFEARVDRQALSSYLRRGAVPAPSCIYEGIAKLRPGCVVAVGPEAQPGALEPVSYWSAGDVAADGLAGPSDMSVDELEALLVDCVRRRMVADVPLGALLSGGVDSSAIVALMQAVSDRPVRTFTIGFGEVGFDEAPFARKIAAHLGTDHTEMRVAPADAQAVIPQLARIYDEPFADSSQIPTYLVCELARRSVTVALSGDGGDEVFAGYARHQWAEPVWRRTRRLPASMRRGVANALGGIPPGIWERTAAAIGQMRPASRLADPRLVERARRASCMAAAETTSSAYDRLTSVWDPSADLVLGVEDVDLSQVARPPLGTFTDEIMCNDLGGYLPDDILTKVDRASMAVSLEVRPPFLDHRLVEAAWRMPIERKLAGGIGKVALREVLYRHVPAHLVERPKAGFALPLGAWLRGPLREWAEGLLAERRLRDDGFLDPVPVRAAWAAHLSGRGSREAEVWAVLMFQAWLDAERLAAPV